MADPPNSHTKAREVWYGTLCFAASIKTQKSAI